MASDFYSCIYIYVFYLVILYFTENMPGLRDSQSKYIRARRVREGKNNGCILCSRRPGVTQSAQWVVLHVPAADWQTLAGGRLYLRRGRSPKKIFVTETMLIRREAP